MAKTSSLPLASILPLSLPPSGKLESTGKLAIKKGLFMIDNSGLASLPPRSGKLGTLKKWCKLASLPHSYRSGSGKHLIFQHREETEN
jgi:hypothetical protein